jgi:hypothetical protein
VPIIFQVLWLRLFAKDECINFLALLLPTEDSYKRELQIARLSFQVLLCSFQPNLAALKASGIFWLFHPSTPRLIYPDVSFMLQTLRLLLGRVCRL